MPEQSIYYLRHGETIWNRKLLLQGTRDSPLTLRGVHLAIAYGEKLRPLIAGGKNIVLHSSPLGRARQTAVILADVLGLSPFEIRESDLLSELNMGILEGRSWTRIESELGISTQDARSWDFRPTDGESRREVRERAKRWLAEPRADGIHVIVSHGGMSRCFRAAYLGLNEAQADKLPPHDHGRFYKLENGQAEEIIAAVGTPIVEAALG